MMAWTQQSSVNVFADATRVDEYMEDLRRAGANGGGRERKKTSIMWHMRMNSSGWVIAEALRQNWGADEPGVCSPTMRP